MFVIRLTGIESIILSMVPRHNQQRYATFTRVKRIEINSSKGRNTRSKYIDIFNIRITIIETRHRNS